MKHYTRIYPEVSEHYGIHPYGKQAWSIVFEGHLLIFERPLHDALRNWRDAVRFATGYGPHWTAVQNHSLGDKSVKIDDYYVRQNSNDKRKLTCIENRVKLWELPCVNYAGVFHYATETEVIAIAFQPRSLARGSVQLWHTFDGWRFAHHTHCDRTVDKKRYYHNTGSGVSIQAIPYPDRTAALLSYLEIAARWFLESEPQEQDPVMRKTLADHIEAARNGIATGEGWRHYNPNTRDEIPNPLSSPLPEINT